MMEINSWRTWTGGTNYEPTMKCYPSTDDRGKDREKRGAGEAG